MKALVTGGAGFIGSNLIEELLDKNYEVVCLDINKDGYWNEEAENHIGDVCDLSTTSSIMKDVDYVFHMAADVKIGECVENPIHCYQNNVVGTAVALQAARLNNVKKFIFSSTSAIYKSGWRMFTEHGPEEPLNPYSSSKKCGEDMCKIYSSLYGLNTISLRYFNVYGPRQHTEGQYSPVLGIFTRQRDENKPLTIVGDGEQTRDFIHVKDIAKANISAAEKCDTTGEYYNVGTGQEYSVQEIADMICPIQTYINQRPGEIKHSCASILKIKNDFGWEPSIELKNWLEQSQKVINYEKENAKR
tara:strand:- start:2300 stop:3208 length:909 start_codon:yes stop_codon:yes gene_type:complete